MLSYAPRPRQQVSPKALTTVIGIHVAGLAVLLTFNPDLVINTPFTPTEVTNIPIDPPPPPIDPPAAPQTPAPVPQTTLTNPPPLTQVSPIGSAPAGPVTIDVPPLTTTVGTGTILAPDPGPPLIEIRSSEANLLTPPDRARPPYPERKRRLGEEAVLSLKLVIAANGRVTSVEPVGEVDRDFLRAARRHILKVWRYAPATQGGDKVQSEKTIRLRFNLEG